MKSILLFALLFLTTQFSIAQNRSKLYYEMSKTKDTITYFIDNPEIFPVSLSFSGTPLLENLKFDTPFQKIFVLKPETKKVKITSFIMMDKTKRWDIKSMPSYRTFMGDLTIKNYDENYVYDLPYKKGNVFEVYQGYNGTFSHQNENSIDFTMPIGTEVLAAREGKVIEIVQKNVKGCPTISCASLGNYIRVLHSDGTIADYFHLQFNGAKVSIGQQIKKGEVIGLSGNTGWSSGPHLHFVVYIPSENEQQKWRKTFKTLFKTDNNPNGEFLKPKTKYSKSY